MDDDLYENFELLRMYLPDNLGETPSKFFNDFNSANNYCPNKYCGTNLNKITAVFLWLFEKNCSKFQNTNSDENNTNAIFLYIISWLSYKLNQITDHSFTKVNDFYTEYVNNQEYDKIIQDANKCTNIKEIINKNSDLLNINIQEMSKFYEPFKLLCSMYDNATRNVYDNTLSDNAIHFLNKYTDLNDYYNIEDTIYSKILYALLTDYNKLKTKCAKRTTDPIQLPTLPTGRATKKFLRHSSIKISVIPMTFIFFGLLIYLGIVYKASKTQFKNQKNKEENISLIYDLKSSDYFRNSNND
ncbi:PIR protein [Plasmodium yoelii]|uniref:YIR protein n=1 Tax=Plasmodium yoelii TaxID=5861 RepID=A0A078K6X8_PLAYE|nr:PIR protein [Plasmodium yoelii]CDU16372.1 YIR protein [Plasmodium yoelii]VTZ72701.1 PIR protein [Plasmodium yoelii]|eukprot:XP_022811500.1 PIR protein [Plasmodium yoelii]